MRKMRRKEMAAATTVSASQCLLAFSFLLFIKCLVDKTVSYSRAMEALEMK